MPTETYDSLLRLDDGDEIPMFRAVLRPNRSWPYPWFRWLLASFLGVNVALAIVFTAAGLWPIAMFFGMNPIWLWTAFRRNYIAGQVREKLHTTDRDLMVERTAPGRQPLHWTFNRYWVRVILEQLDEDTCHVLVGSHGRFIAIGEFLSPPERVQLAKRLKQALHR